MSAQPKHYCTCQQWKDNKLATIHGLTVKSGAMLGVNKRTNKVYLLMNRSDNGWLPV